jgi:hypothetical protein
MSESGSDSLTRLSGRDREGATYLVGKAHRRFPFSPGIYDGREQY